MVLGLNVSCTALNVEILLISLEHRWGLLALSGGRIQYRIAVILERFIKVCRLGDVLG